MCIQRKRLPGGKEEGSEGTTCERNARSAAVVCLCECVNGAPLSSHLLYLKSQREKGELVCVREEQAASPRENEVQLKRD